MIKMNSGMVLNIIMLMLSGGCLYFIASIFFGNRVKPPRASSNGTIWCKKSTPGTRVLVTNMNSNTVEYYYTHVNGNGASSYKMYKDSMSNFQRNFKRVQ